MNTILSPIEQVKPSSLVKSTYGFASTKNILETFNAKGWQVVSEAVQKTKNEKRVGYQKHLIKLTHPDFKFIEGLSERHKSVPQLCLLNSHDGSAALRIFYGVLRVACLNGIIAGAMFREFKAVHNNKIIENLNAGLDYMTSGIDDLNAAVTKLANRQLTEIEVAELTRQLVDLRLARVDKVLSVDYSSALKVRRVQDSGTDAYSVFNRIQESIVRGGVKYSYERNVTDGQGTIIGTRIIETSSKRLTSIQSQVEINREAWDIVSKLVA